MLFPFNVILFKFVILNDSNIFFPHYKLTNLFPCKYKSYTNFHFSKKFHIVIAYFYVSIFSQCQSLVTWNSPYPKCPKFNSLFFNSYFDYHYYHNYLIQWFLFQINQSNHYNLLHLCTITLFSSYSYFFWILLIFN